MPIEKFSQKMYNDYILYLRKVLSNDRSINSYLRDLITTLHFLMKTNKNMTYENMKSFIKSLFFFGSVVSILFPMCYNEKNIIGDL